MKASSLMVAMAEKYEREQAAYIKAAIAATLRKLGHREVSFAPAELTTILDGLLVESFALEDGTFGVRLVEIPPPQHSG